MISNKTQKAKSLTPIKPLFLPIEDSQKMGSQIIKFARDDYNKSTSNALIDAKTDAEAISTFLREFTDSKLTLRSYAKEIERLLLWCIHVAKVNISSLRRNHLLDYQAFLKNPSPKAAWCGPKAPRQLKNGTINPKWRVFNHGLSPTTLNKTITILDSFFNYLVQTNYLIGNPLAVDKRRKKSRRAKPQIIDRYLELDEIRASLDALDGFLKRPPLNSQKYSKSNKSIKKKEFQAIRAKYIILLLFYTGLRIAEAANHIMGNFIQREHNWFLRVIGKGKKLREIPVPDELLKALMAFRLNVGLPSSQPKFREKTPLIPMENLKRSISSRRIDQILKWAFSLGALKFDTTKPRKASKLRAASAHWLRHSYVTYLLDSGAPLKVAQENAGHSNISTTMHYRHVAQTDRHAATRGLSIGKNKELKQGNNQKYQG